MKNSFIDTKFIGSTHDDEFCYCNDIILHLKINEKKYCISKVEYEMSFENEYTKIKKCLYETTRIRLIEWLIAIQDHYSSNEETLEMAVRLFNHIYFKNLHLNTDYDTNIKTNEKLWENTKLLCDSLKNKYCDCGKNHNSWLPFHELQLIAITCFFISCKFWERFPPKLSKLILLTDYSYTEYQIILKEKEILIFLNFEIKIPLVSQYLEFYLMHESQFLLSKTVTISYYLLNLTLTEPKFVNRLASSIAGVIITFSKMLLCSFASWDPKKTLNVYDNKLFDLECFSDILNDLWIIFQKSLLNKDIYKIQKKKFSDKKYSYLLQYLEHSDWDSIKTHYKELLKRSNIFNKM